MSKETYHGLRGRLVCLKVIEAQDIEQLYEWKNEYELATLIKAYPLPLTRHEIDEWVKKNQSDKNQVFLGVFLLKGLALVGVARLKYIDRISANTELGIYIGDKDHRGKGLGKEALNLILAYAFRDLNLHKVYLKVLESNTKAIRLYEGCGFSKEGTLREQFWSQGRYENIVSMGILRDEFNR